ncbi:hypothetical protein BX616_002605, partial [Lobosporangium transversale]
MESILQYVGLATLRLVVPLVCHRWYNVAQPLLKRSVHIKAIQFDRSPNEQAQEKKVKYESEQMLALSLRGAYTLVYQAGLFPKSDIMQLPANYEKTAWATLKDAMISLSETAPEAIRIRTLVLDAELKSVIWRRLQPLLGFFGLGLTTLHLDSIPDGTIIYLGPIMEYCPHLKNLKVMARLFSTGDMTSRLGEIEAGPSKQWPLRSVTFDNMVLLQTALETLAQNCPDLKELRMIRCKPLIKGRVVADCPENCLLFKQRREQFFNHLKDHCRKLRSLHVSVAVDLRYKSFEEVAPISQFPLIEHWGVATLSMSKGKLSLASTLLDMHRKENRLTSVEIVLSICNSLVFRGPNTGNWIHLLLCESPHLEHFKAPDVNLPLHLLYVSNFLRIIPRSNNDEGDDSFISPVPRRIWACRGLKTLHIKINESCSFGMGDLEEQARVLYGYISRVCPNLEDLCINRTQMLTPSRYPVSMCLLSRLKRLRTLQVTGVAYLCDKDIDWIKERYYYDTSQQAGLKSEQGSQGDKQGGLIKSIITRQWPTLRHSIIPSNFNDNVSLSELSVRGFHLEDDNDNGTALRTGRG